MRSRCRLTPLVRAALRAAVFVFALSPLLSTSPAAAEWTGFLGGPEHRPVAGEGPAAPFARLFLFQAGGDCLGSPAVAEGMVFFGCRDNHLYAVDAVSGAQRWRFRADAAVDSTPCYIDGHLYFGSSGGRLYCLRASDGRLRFRSAAFDPIRSSPVVADGRVLFTTDGGTLVALDASTGEPVRETPLGAPSQSSPALSGGRIFVGDNAGVLHALDAATCEPLFTVATGGMFGLVSPASAGGSVLFAPGILDDRLYVADAATGAGLSWHVTAGGVSAAPALPSARYGIAARVRLAVPDGTESARAGSSSPARAAGEAPSRAIAAVDPSLRFHSQTVSVDGNHAYMIFGRSTATLVAIDLSGPALLWSLALGTFPESVGHFGAPLLAPQRVYVTNGEGTVLAVDRTTGQATSAGSLFDTCYSTGAIDGERLYFTTLRGTLVALAAGPDIARASTDALAPAIAILEPAEGSVCATSRPALRVRLTDPQSGVNPFSIALTLDGAPVPFTIRTTDFGIEATAPQLPDGMHAMRVEASDWAGNAAAGERAFEVRDAVSGDQIPPRIESPAPAPDSVIRYTRVPEISVLLVDAGSGIAPASIDLTLNEEPVTADFDPATGRLSFVPNAPLADRVHAVAVAARDRAGNPAAPLRWSFTIAHEADPDAPQVDTLSPADGVTVIATRRPEISARVVDERSGVDPSTVALTVDGTLLDAAWSAESGRIVARPASPLADGEHVVRLCVADRAGNDRILSAWRFRIDFRMEPRDLRVASVTDASAAVTFATRVPVSGRVLLSLSQDMADAIEAFDVRGAGTSAALPCIPLAGLAAGTDYFLRAVASVDGEEETLDASGAPFRFRTAPASGAPGAALPVAGVVRSGGAAASGALVHLTALRADGAFSLPLVALCGADGAFSLDLAQLRDTAGIVRGPAPQDALLLHARSAGGLHAFARVAPVGVSFPLDAGELETASDVAWEIPLGEGIQFVTPPVSPVPALDSHDLFARLPSLVEVGAFDAVSQFMHTAALVFGEPAGERFPYGGSGGAILRLSAAATLSLRGVRPAAPAPVAIEPGLNLIAFAGCGEGLDRPLPAFDSIALLEAHPALSECHRFDAATQRFAQASFRLFDGVHGSRFALSEATSCFVRATSGFAFTPPRPASFGATGAAALPAPSPQPASAAPQRAPSASEARAVLTPPALVAGRILRADGSPAAGVEVALTLAAAGEPPVPFTARTDDAGVWHILAPIAPADPARLPRLLLNARDGAGATARQETDLPGESPFAVDDLRMDR